MKKAFLPAFKKSVPVLFGYIPLGIGFGIMLSAQGYTPLWAFFMSLFIYAGTGQYLCVGLLAAGADVWQVVLLTFLLHFRHFFYGLSLINKYHDIGKWKLYPIFALTDETYAILSTTDAPEGVSPKKFYFLVSALNHSYWIAGGVIGAALGAVIPFSTKGIDFVMTALFAVLVVEQWKTNKIHLPALLGFFIPIVGLLIFGADSFLIPALIVLAAVLMFLRPKLDKEEASR